MRRKRAAMLVESMLEVLASIGLPLENLSARMRIRIAEAALAVTDIRTAFSEAKSREEGAFLTTRKIIDFENKYLGENVSPGSYDDIRRRHLQPLIFAGLIVNSASLETQATNNPTRAYAASPEFSALLRSFSTDRWACALEEFRKANGERMSALARGVDSRSVPVHLPSGRELSLSPGEHNQLQRDIIEVFLPRFGFGAEVLYLGDSNDRFLHLDDKRLSELHFFALEHEELPDVVAYSASHNLLFLIEAVHSCGPMSAVRVAKLMGKLHGVSANVVLVSAFESRRTFRRFVADIAWETEVWIADDPEHMIHFNGWKFLEIHKREGRSSKKGSLLKGKVK